MRAQLKKMEEHNNRVNNQIAVPKEKIRQIQQEKEGKILQAKVEKQKKSPLTRSAK